MKDVEIIGMIKSYVKKSLVGMGALKGAPCEVQGVVDAGDGTQTLTLQWKDTAGVTHTTDITLPSAIFAVLNPTNGQTLRYNSVSGKFENSNVSFSADLEDLDNVVITSVQDGQVLTYDAVNNRWINADGSVVAALNDLTDVVITTAQNGQILTYDATAQKWLNTTLEISASDVDYDNTTSGLTATDVQGAIDEIKLDVSQLSASKIGFDGTTSGLSANKVQGAIDELADEKVDKETGKGLSTNDFTDALKNKLDGIEDNAEENDIDIVKVNGTALTPDANKAVDILLNMTKLSDVDLTGLADEMILIYDAANNKWYAGANTGATYTAGEGIEIDQNNVISSKIVLFTGTEAQWNALPLADKIKFTHYATNDDQTGQIDPVPTQNSANLMTSGGIYTALQNKADASDITDAIEALDVTDAAVAGSYVTEVSEADGKIAVVREAADAVPTESSNKMVKSGGVYAANENIYEVMGQNGAKNLSKPINSTTYLDITVVCDSDGVLTVTGTASASGGRLNIVSDSFTLKAGTYKIVHTSDDLTKYSSIVCHNKADNTSLGYSIINNGIIDNSHAQFTLTSDTECFMGMNTYQGTNYGTGAGTKEYAMVVLADDTDITYQPYAKTNQELTSNVIAIDNARIMYGVENILPNTLESGTAATSITYTRNSDGTVSVSGSAVGNAILAIGKITGLTKVRLTGCPSGGGGSAYQIQPKDLTDNTYPFTGDYGEGRNYTLDPTHVYRMDIVIREGYSISGTKLFKPMVVDLSAYSGTTYDDYVPYAMTNRELTNGGYSILSATANTDIIDLDNLTFVKSVKVVNATGYFHTKVAAAKNDLLYTFDEKTKAGNVGYKPYVLAANNSGSTFLLRVEEKEIRIDENNGIPVGNYAIIGGIFVQ